MRRIDLWRAKNRITATDVIKACGRIYRRMRKPRAVTSREVEKELRNAKPGKRN